MTLFDLQPRSIRVGENNKFTLFEDKDILLNATFKWDRNWVEEIIFELTNKPPTIPDPKKYKICEIQTCRVNDSKFGDYTIIHLIDNVDNMVEPQIFKADKAKIGNLELQNGEFAMFLFKVEEDSRCGTNFSCSLDSLTPKTKDGSIIISI